MIKNCFGLAVVILISQCVCWGQASLPVYRDVWGSTPTGWTDGQGGTPTYGSDCGGSDGTSGRLDATNESFTIFFSTSPALLNYNVKGNGFSSPGPFDVLESANGTVWTSVRSFSSLSGTCTAYSDPLNSATRYVRFIYTNKSSGNVQLDNVSITSGIVGVSNPTNLSISNPCINSLSLGWTLPTGYSSANNTIMVFAKATSAITVGSATSSLTTYTADADFSGVGTAYQNDPLAKCVYKGDGTSVNITGLASSTVYQFLVFHVIDAAPSYSSGISVSSATSSISPVTNTDATPGNAQIAVTWLNPTTCYDEILVLGKSSTISDTPTGDGIGTTASSNFGTGTPIGASTAIYKGSGTSVTVTNLVNGTNYCFKIFTRKGSTWSTGVEICAIPNTTSGTILNPGDMAIVGYDAQYLGSGNPDLIAFMNLVPLNPGTTFLMTDNGFEVVAGANVRDYSWSNAEGVIKLTWNGPGVLPKGTVTKYFTDAGAAGWSVSCVSDRDGVVAGAGNGCTVTDFNFAVAGDQLFILQGTWDEGTYTCGTTYNSAVGACANASFSGRMIAGFNGISPGWVPTSQTPYTVSTSQLARNSRLPRELRCFNTESTSNITRLEYKDAAVDNGTQRVILGNIKNTTNWTTFAAGGFSLGAFTVGTGWTAGHWIGDISTNWFDCANWDNLYVPDENTNVALGAFSTNTARVDATFTYADEFQYIAKSNNLDIDAQKVEIDASSSNVLEVHGDLKINATSGLDMSDGSTGTPDGQLYLYGNWTNLQNEVEYKQGESTVHLVGTGNQTITNDVSDNETFYNLVIDKPSGDVFLTADDDITIDLLGKMTFANGLVNSNSITGSLVIFQTTATSAGANSNSFVNGPVQKLTSSTTPFIFPVGDVASGVNLYRPLTATPTSTSATTFETEYTGSGYGNYTLGTGVSDVTTKEWWRLDRISGSANPVVTLSWGAESDIPNELTSSISGLLVAHFDGTDWDSQGGTAQTGNSINGTVTATVATTVFGPFTLASNVVVSLPIHWHDFYGISTKNDHILHWTTRQESNIKEFAIEKSLDGVTFTLIGSVLASTNNLLGSNYQFIDKNAHASAYYRIKSTDYSGFISFSKTIYLSGNQGYPSFSLYPNPMENQTLLESDIPTEFSDVYESVLSNNLGGQISSTIGTLVDLNLWLNNAMNSVPAGVYLLKINAQNTQSQVLKITKN